MNVSVNYYRLIKIVVNRKKFWNDCIIISVIKCKVY